MAQKKKANKTRRTLLGFGYIIAGCFLVYTLFYNGMDVFEKKGEIEALEQDKARFEEEKEDLINEIELLKNEDYVARYARENYVFTRDGERVAIIPDSSTE